MWTSSLVIFKNTTTTQGWWNVTIFSIKAFQSLNMLKVDYASKSFLNTKTTVLRQRNWSLKNTKDHQCFLNATTSYLNANSNFLNVTKCSLNARIFLKKATKIFLRYAHLKCYTKNSMNASNTTFLNALKAH